MDYIIRKREKDDCASIAHIVTVAWNETYKGIVPNEFLNNLYNTEETRAKNTYNKFDENNNHQYVLVVDDKVVGFINVGSSEETDYENCGEIHAVYIIDGYKGHGYGRKLVEAGIQELKDMGYDKMVIGCLVGNPTNSFYEHIGGKYVKQRIFELLQLPENVYYYESI